MPRPGSKGQRLRTMLLNEMHKRQPNVTRIAKNANASYGYALQVLNQLRSEAGMQSQRFTNPKGRKAIEGPHSKLNTRRAIVMAEIYKRMLTGKYDPKEIAANLTKSLRKKPVGRLRAVMPWDVTSCFSIMRNSGVFPQEILERNKIETAITSGRDETPKAGRKRASALPREAPRTVRLTEKAIEFSEGKPKTGNPPTTLWKATEAKATAIAAQGGKRGPIASALLKMMHLVSSQPGLKIVDRRTFDSRIREIEKLKEELEI